MDSEPKPIGSGESESTPADSNEPAHGTACGTANRGTSKPELLKIGDFARLAGTNLRTLRYYEEVGILLPAHRSAGGFRYYRPTDVNRLRMAQNLQDLGLSLEEIADLLATRTDGTERDTVLARVRDALSKQEALIGNRMKELDTQLKAVQTARKKLTECEQCHHVPSHENNFCEPCPIDHRQLPEAISALF